jgi:hypothetical protein
MMIDFNESLFTEFVENTHLDDERQTTTTTTTTINSLSEPTTTINIEIRRRTEGLIFILLSKLSYETTDTSLRRYLYDRRLISLLIRYISSCDEPNPRAIRILHRLTRLIDSFEYVLHLGLPYLIRKHFYVNQMFANTPTTVNADDQYLLNVLLNDNRAFFHRLSWTNEHTRLNAMETMLVKNIEHLINTPYVLNEIMRQLNDDNCREKLHIMLTLVATLKYEFDHRDERT